MMSYIDKTYRITLLGHRDFNGHKVLDDILLPLLTDIIRARDFVEIYIGRNGEFDIYASTVIKRAQNATGREKSEFICVLPYYEKNIEFYERYYDTVMIPESVIGAHPKNAIIKRNKWMVEVADLLIFYVERESGGAYNALKYAKSLGKHIINLAEE